MKHRLEHNNKRQRFQKNYFQFTKKKNKYKILNTLGILPVQEKQNGGF